MTRAIEAEPPALLTRDGALADVDGAAETYSRHDLEALVSIER